MCFNIENSIQYWNSIQFNIEIQFKLEYLIIKHNFEQEVALIFCSYVLIFKNGQCKPEFHYNSESLNKILNRFCTLILQTLVSRFQIWGCTPSSTHLFKTQLSLPHRDILGYSYSQINLINPHHSVILLQPFLPFLFTFLFLLLLSGIPRKTLW